MAFKAQIRRGSSLTCLQEMMKRRHSALGVQFIVLADTLISAMVRTVFSEHQRCFHAISDTLCPRAEARHELSKRQLEPSDGLQHSDHTEDQRKK